MKERQNNKETGFTLLELVISLTILTTIIVLAFTTIRIGLKAWKKGDEKVEFLYRMKYLADLMEKEISSVQPYYFAKVEEETKEGSKEESKEDEKENVIKNFEKVLVFNGLKNHISFVSALDSGDPSMSASGLREVSFFIEEGGENDENRLVMEEKSINLDQPFERSNEQAITSTILSEDINEIKFRYLKLKRSFQANHEYIGEWMDEFTFEENSLNDSALPRAVEVTFGMKTENNKEEEPGKENNNRMEEFYPPPFTILINAGMEQMLFKRNRGLND